VGKGGEAAQDRPLAGVTGWSVSISAGRWSSTRGPVARNALTDPNPAAVDTAVELSATVDASSTSGLTIVSASYSFDAGAGSELRCVLPDPAAVVCEVSVASRLIVVSQFAPGVGAN
jgi:hypothetical protein